ncbi:DUF4169 family protein [Aureimonas jatrophae]|jgi:hypothetical protein|uniref:DUF4169 family protein n=1 Tax=Aureimonas jatrophae TaxID=1166073 RepID=A0A1H0GRX5_9HYPH|nr:DUF4169 family protein [Aureimonas jatrophae]MBB3949737.1 hypothetical protein [Aureimonas jatrophae]SDO09615.1 protein of unknown function [Aureimonas jatrophae]
MVAEVVNLRLARKRAKRKSDDQVAEQNRLLHGQTAGQRARIKHEMETRDRHLDASRIDSRHDPDDVT